MANITNETETDFIESCETGDITKAEGLLRQVNPSCLKERRTSEGRTCLHVAVLTGDPDLLGELAAKLDLKELIKITDNQGDTALHVAVRIYSVDMVKQMLKLAAKVQLEAGLCGCKNNKQETPLNMAIRLQFLEAVELLITRTKNALEDENKFLLHRVVSLNQVKLLKILIKFSEGKKLLSKVINLPYRPPVDNDGSRAVNPQHIQPVHTAVRNIYEHENRPTQPIVRGDMPLHIAARNKYERMVDLLLTVPDRKKHALNDEGKTPVEIAREVMEYYECFRIIRKLGDFKGKVKPFMYCAPQVSYEKHKRAADMIDQAYKERRNAELVVAALLATMTFTAAFSAPGGFQTDPKLMDEQGIPVLISFTSFRVFLLFNCIAFFLSLFTCIMWEMTSELTVGDKLFFMTINGVAVCLSFGFTAYGFMAAVFTVLDNNMNTFSWVVLGGLILMSLCGVLAVLYLAVRFAVSRARFQRLCGTHRRIDDFVVWVWKIFERCGFLDLTRFIGDKIRASINGDYNPFWKWTIS
ncbi:ankyrin repeat-containing protein ITN1-like [Cryptomeria japonica]|uniref:ankyrin repeat-containing protein ITN1-like n=1 Tax=Cryptomeria japonica TaxID=3369 RepID=UPI0027DA97F0|nr:ankyrin repeat-containing protein ITN1-like [Cryptomeria japonica]